MERSRNDDGTKKKDKVSAFIGTSVFYAVLLVIFLFFGFKTELPLPEEMNGIEVMLGELDYGSPGASLPELPTINQSNPPPSSPEKAVDASESPVETQTQSDVVVPDKKEAIKEKVVEKKTVAETTTNTPEKKVADKEAERKSNPKYELTKSDNSSGKGSGADEGNQGDVDGSLTSKNPGKGSIGKGNWSLAGRGLTKPPPPIDDNSQQVQRIVIEIVVNKLGVVVGAKATIKGGGTITTGALVEKAIASAKQARFTPDPEGSEEQYGTITYDLKLN